MTLLTDEQETFIWAVFVTSMPTHRASFARGVGIHLNRQTSGKLGFVGDHALQFSKRPFRIRGVSFSLLFARLFALLPLGSISDVCQMFQSDQMVGILGYDVFRDTMIGVGFQPSLSSANHHKATSSRTSAFLLQTLSQSRIMVCPGNNLLPRVEDMFTACIAGYGQVANAYIYTSTARLVFWVRIGGFDFKAHQQVELLVGFVVPELGRSNLGTMLDKLNMFVISGIGNNDTTIQSQDTDVVLGFEAIVFLILVFTL